MSQIKKHGYDKCLYKEIGELRIYLYKGRDLWHGRGWFCHIYRDYGKSVATFANNKFAAVRDAMNEIWHV